ncbi:ABC transporter ATP-binding protein [Psychromarinibacter sp. S121]|uniref:ABC transporter ATP-binding protein n=1 Tax=Psychromarinibacter sp. S121 TaxID=3415127 RepID=UPI003C7B1FC5
MAFLNINSVDKSYGTHSVLKDINLAIEAGEFIVFVGPSGCGKSTLLRMISGLEEITGGTMTLDGKVLNTIEPSKRGISMVFQSYALYPHMTAFENVSFGLRMARTAKEIVKTKVANAAGILQLDKLLDRKPANLSGGQKQRVAIGRAIVREPRVFLFDEPLSNLDAELRVQMRAELMELHRRLGVTMIYVTHDQVEAMTLADRMVVMNGGRIQQVGRPLDLYDDPDNTFVAGFVGSPKMNLLPATAAGATCTGICGSGSLTLPAGLGASGPVTLGVRPEKLLALAADAAPPPGALVLEGKLVLAEELGDVTYLHIETADGTRLIIRSERLRGRVGDDARVAISPADILLFDADGNRVRSEARAAA